MMQKSPVFHNLKIIIMDKKINILTEIWKDLLKVESIDINCNFFEIGGNSIKALILINNINEALDTNLFITDLIENYSINKIAEFINKGQSSNE